MKKMSKAMYGKSIMKAGGSSKMKKMQKGGKVDNSITGKMRRGLDWLIGGDTLRSTARSLNKKLDPTRTAVNKSLDKNVRQPINATVYGPKKVAKKPKK